MLFGKIQIINVYVLQFIHRCLLLTICL